MTHRLHPVDPTTVYETDSFKINEISDRTKLPIAVTRKSDGKQFRINQYVTNGTKMKGHITAFEPMISEDNKTIDMYVSHTWSGIGMDLDSLQDAQELPSRFQIGAEVAIKFSGFHIHLAEVIKIHFTDTKVQYDLEVLLKNR